MNPIDSALNAFNKEAKEAVKKQLLLQKWRPQIALQIHNLRSLTNAHYSVDVTSLDQQSTIHIRAKSYHVYSSFNTQELVDALAQLVESNPVHSEVKNFPEYVNRDYGFTFETEDPNVKIRIVLEIWINQGSTTCRKVQKGTRIIEQPIYEIECDPT